MNRFISGTIAVTLLALLATPAFAKKNNPNVQLEFVPQQAVGGAEAIITSGMIRRPIAVRVVNERPGEDPAEIGTRTDDDDRRHTLKAVNDVVEYVAEAIDDALTQWGIKTEDSAGLVLEIGLVRFDILETNQAVGATYNANVRFVAELKAGGDWSGGSVGDATRYGRKFSNANVNEVLSDALLEALAEIISDDRLRQIWED